MGNNKKYKLKVIWDNAVHTKEVDGYLLGLYYLVIWNDYLEKENTWELFSTVMHSRKIVSIFYKHYPENPTATSALIDSIPTMVKPIIKFSTKQKHKTPGKKHYKIYQVKAISIMSSKQ